MKHFKDGTTGCWLCKNLQWEMEDSSFCTDGGYFYCDFREDTEFFKTFPCNRRLKCCKEREAK